MKPLRLLLALAILMASSGCAATTALMSLEHQNPPASDVHPQGTSEQPRHKLSARDWWVVPVIVIGFVPCIAFDIATCPIQFILGAGKEAKSITG